MTKIISSLAPRFNSKRQYDDITARLVITYTAENVADIESKEIILSFDDAIANSNDSAAIAFEALMTK